LRKTTIFDLDGTLLDVSDRYYSVFNTFWNITSLSKDIYWSLKRKLRDDWLVLDQILGRVSGADYERYLKYKKSTLEQELFLRLDRPLVDWRRIYRIESTWFILTLRRHPEALFSQLEYLGLSEFRERMVVLSPEGPRTKVTWLCTHVEPGVCVDVIGDSETDLSCGERPLSCVYLVTTGLADPKLLLNCYRSRYGSVSDICIVNDVDQYLHIRGV